MQGVCLLLYVCVDIFLDFIRKELFIFLYISDEFYNALNPLVSIIIIFQQTIVSCSKTELNSSKILELSS